MLFWSVLVVQMLLISYTMLLASCTVQTVFFGVLLFFLSTVGSATGYVKLRYMCLRAVSEIKTKIHSC